MSLRSASSWFFATSIPVFFLSWALLFDVADATAQKSTRTKPSSAKAKKFRPRLKAGWGQLAITDSQREKIYSVQRAIRPKIDEHKKEIEMLEAEEDSKSRAVLTPEQLKKLEEYEASRKSRSSRKKSSG